MWKSKFKSSLTLAVFMMANTTLGWSADAFDKSRQTVSETNKSLQARQQKINQLYDSSEKLLDEYKTVISELETYNVYNQQLKDIIGSQQNDLASLKKQIVEVEITAQQIMPMMQRMITALESFIAQDMPFLPEERQNRLEKLKNTMKRADITVAEKYRKILEAYQIEIEYGKTLEAYDAQLDKNNVSFLKIGRIGFYYRTPDSMNYSAWNQKQKKWQPINDQEVKRSIDIGLKIARKQQSPELLSILVARPGDPS